MFPKIQHTSIYVTGEKLKFKVRHSRQLLLACVCYRGSLAAVLSRSVSKSVVHILVPGDFSVSGFTSEEGVTVTLFLVLLISYPSYSPGLCCGAAIWGFCAFSAPYHLENMRVTKSLDSAKMRNVSPRPRLRDFRRASQGLHVPGQ